MIAFDADVLIYAATPGHPLGSRVVALFDGHDDTAGDEQPTPVGIVELRPVDEATATLAVILGARRRLREADAIHLATAVQAGADQFLTNNSDDFGADIDEIDIVYPDQLSDRPE